MAKHGTYARLNQHKREGTKPCIACTEAGRQYMAKYRQDPDVRAKNRRDVKAREMAQRRVAKLHPFEYNTFYLEELRKLEESGWPRS